MTVKALGPVIVVIDEADAVLGNRSSDGDSGVSSRVFATLAAHLGDSSLRGRELWIARTSRPDLLAIDMKRQGRFGLCLPLFAAQNEAEVLELFRVLAKVKKLNWTPELEAVVKTNVGTRHLTGSDVEAIVMRAIERSVLRADGSAAGADDVRVAIESFVDPLDPQLLELQEVAAVLACSDKRFLPEHFAEADRGEMTARYQQLRRGLTGRA